MIFEWDPVKAEINRLKENVVRIISARRATRRERERLAAYWSGKHD